jgi:hypothetical protein
MFDALNEIPDEPGAAEAGDTGFPLTSDPGDAAGEPSDSAGDAGTPAGDLTAPPGLGSAARALAAVVEARKRAAERSAGAFGAELAGLEAAHERALELLAAAEATHDPD